MAPVAGRRIAERCDPVSIGVAIAQLVEHLDRAGSIPPTTLTHNRF